MVAFTIPPRCGLWSPWFLKVPDRDKQMVSHPGAELCPCTAQHLVLANKPSAKLLLSPANLAGKTWCFEWIKIWKKYTVETCISFLSFPFPTFYSVVMTADITINTLSKSGQRPESCPPGSRRFRWSERHLKCQRPHDPGVKPLPLNCPARTGRSEHSLCW